MSDLVPLSSIFSVDRNNLDFSISIPNLITDFFETAPYELVFIYGWLLWLILLLPILWWFLKVTPPSPRHITFPAISLIRGITHKNQSADKAPWWSIFLRLFFVALLIIGFSQPQLQQKSNKITHESVFVVLENDWGSARNWPQIQNAFINLADHAYQNNLDFYFATTHGDLKDYGISAKIGYEFGPFDIPEIKQAFDNFFPYVTQQTPNQTTLTKLKSWIDNDRLPTETIWLSDGLADPGELELLHLLQKNGPIHVQRPDAYNLPLLVKLERNIVNKSAKDLNEFPIHVVLRRPAPFDLEIPHDHSSIPSLLEQHTKSSPKYRQLENGFLARELTLTAYGASETAANKQIKQQSGQRILYQQQILLPAYEIETKTPLKIPTDLLSQVTYIQLQTKPHAGNTYILDERWNKRHIGILQQDHMSNRPLLSGIWYLDRAASHIGPVTIAPLDILLRQNLTSLIIPGAARLSPKEQQSLQSWVKDGGILIQFAGNPLTEIDMLDPKQTANFPVKLRSGGRTMNGNLQWETPLLLDKFTDQGPLAQLEIPAYTRENLSINKHIMSQPSIESSQRSWATLTDGTSLISGTAMGHGWSIFFHSGVEASWSDLATYALFPQILDRLTRLSNNSVKTQSSPSLSPNKKDSTSDNSAMSQPIWQLSQILNYNGKISSVIPPKVAKTSPTHLIEISRATPAGLYLSGENLGSNISNAQTYAVNLSEYITQFRISESRNTDQFYNSRNRSTFPIASLFYLAALLIFLLDYLATLYLRGQLPDQRRIVRLLKNIGQRKTHISWLGVSIISATLGSLLFATSLLFSTLSYAQTLELDEKIEEIRPLPTPTPASPLSYYGENDDQSGARMAYIKTGNNSLDQISADGLTGLAEILNRRTAAQISKPTAVDPAKDELSFFALIYWPISENQPDLSQTAKDNMNNYLGFGGTVLFDLRNPDQLNKQTQHLQRLTKGLNIPPVEQISAEHVLGKSFYLLHDFPGRWQGQDLWLEPENGGTADGVSRVIIGAADWASAWALDTYGRPRFPVSPGGERQREYAFRFGVNLMMYMLTGNYKKDQVHMPAILKRLGQ